MSLSLESKTVLVTGAASGIGKECALLMAQRGAELVLTDINQEQGASLAEKIISRGQKAHFVPADVTSTSDIIKVIAYIEANCGKLDCAVNNAGIEPVSQPITECDDATFDRVLGVNLKGVFICMREQVKSMLKSGGGQIINMASVAGMRAAPTLSAFAASKAGVIGLTKTVASEYAKQNIRVNAVCPSFVNTPLRQRSMALLGETAAQSILKANPMQRLGESVEIAQAIAWLASNESSFMTGQSVVLDGGMTA